MFFNTSANVTEEFNRSYS